MSIGKVSALVGILLGLATLSAGSWGAWELRQEVGNNTSWRLIQVYEQLSLIRQSRRLTQIEWVKWCQAGIQLRIFVTCPPR